MNEITIKLREEPLFYYGQKVYMVATAIQGKEFSSICPICDGEKKIQYKGMEFRCPLCQSSSYRSPNNLYLREITVEEYIVNSVTIQGPDTKKSFGKDRTENDYPVAQFSAFSRCRNGYDSVKTKKLINSKSHIDPEIEAVLKVDDPSRYVFTEAVKAKKLAQALIERDKERLAEFNKTHGTNFEYPF